LERIFQIPRRTLKFPLSPAPKPIPPAPKPIPPRRRAHPAQSPSPSCAVATPSRAVVEPSPSRRHRPAGHRPHATTSTPAAPSRSARSGRPHPWPRRCCHGYRRRRRRTGLSHRRRCLPAPHRADYPAAATGPILLKNTSLIYT
jgi:hypothetical protein